MDAAEPQAGRSRGYGAIVSLACGAALATAVVAFVAAVYGLGPDNYIFLGSDFRQIHVHLWSYYRDALREGRLPLWTPHTFSGWPFAADLATRTFYPASLLSLAFALPTAAVIRLTAHLTLGALATWLLLRQAFGLRRGPAVFGGIVYALCGAIVGQTYAGHQAPVACAYLPLLVLCIDRAGADPVTLSRRWLAAGGLVLGLQILSGSLPYVWLTLLFCCLYRLGDRLCRGPRDLDGWAREAIVLGVMGVIGIGIAAVQLLPTVELTRVSTRAGTGYEYAASGSYPPHLLPSLFLGSASATRMPFMWEYYGYVGALPPLLAVVALARVRQERRLIVLGSIGLLAVLYMLGRHSFLMPLLWQHVPTFSLFRIPARALIVVDLILAIMAAIGLDVIAGWVATRGRQGARIAIVLVALACVVQLVDLAYHARANRRYLHTRPRPLMEQPFAVRLADTLAGDGSWYRYWFHPESFRENHAYALGARSVTGYDNMYLERYRRFFYFMTDTAIDPLAVTGIGRDTFGNARSLFPFKILGVKYAAYRGQLVVNPEPVRRAWFVTRARRVASEDQALAYMRSERFDPQREVIFEPVEADRLELPTREVSSAAGDAIDLDIVVTEVSPEHLRIELGPHPEGYVVLSEMFYPGWRAYAGGRELPIYRADYLLRALRVAAGGHLAIDVVFEPASLRYGALVTSATLLVVVALLGWPRRSPTSRRGQQAHADRPAHSRS